MNPVLVFGVLFATYLAQVYCLSGPNICTDFQDLPTNVEIEKFVPVEKEKSVWTWKFPFRTNKKYIDYEKQIVEEIRLVSTPVKVCCSGFQEIRVRNGSDVSFCVPFCSQFCRHGFCAKPEVCKCLEGFYGRDCSQRCRRGYYGPDCAYSCKCEQGSSCNPITGDCICQAGYTGQKCETECPEGFFGTHCHFQCACQNDAECDKSHGTCRCPPGFAGAYCEKKCSNGKFGANCLGICSCQNRGECHHQTGKCDCPPGWTGPTCAYPCANGYFGKNCLNKCNCGDHADGCNPETGQCRCHDGWVDPVCSTPCRDPFYGPNCVHRCSCTELEFCDVVQGCQCRFGTVTNSTDLDNPCYDPRLQFEHLRVDAETIPAFVWPGYVVGLFIGIILLAIVISLVYSERKMRSSSSPRLQDEHYVMYNRGVETVNIGHRPSTLENVGTHPRRQLPALPANSAGSSPSSQGGVIVGAVRRFSGRRKVVEEKKTKSIPSSSSVFYTAASSTAGSRRGSQVENVYDEPTSFVSTVSDIPVPTYEEAVGRTLEKEPEITEVVVHQAAVEDPTKTCMDCGETLESL